MFTVSHIKRNGDSDLTLCGHKIGDRDYKGLGRPCSNCTGIRNGSVYTLIKYHRPDFEIPKRWAKKLPLGHTN